MKKKTKDFYTRLTGIGVLTGIISLFVSLMRPPSTIINIESNDSSQVKPQVFNDQAVIHEAPKVINLIEGDGDVFNGEVTIIKPAPPAIDSGKTTRIDLNDKNNTGKGIIDSPSGMIGLLKTPNIKELNMVILQNGTPVHVIGSIKSNGLNWTEVIVMDEENRNKRGFVRSPYVASIN